MPENRVSPILDSNGTPFHRANGHAALTTTRRDDSAVRKSLLGSFSSYLESLLSTRQPAASQATQPFQRHAWVFAAAMAQAQMASAAPFRVYRETDAETRRRNEQAIAKGRRPMPRVGHRRTALERHLAGGLSFRRLALKSAEADFEHPLADLFRRPNPYQVGNQLFQLTHLWMAVRGECFWVLTDEAGNPPGVTALPERIWVISPDCFKPLYSKGQRGELVGWELRPPSWMPNAESRKVTLDVNDVVVHRIPDPNNPHRGLSRIAAAASAIDLDFSIRSNSRSLMENRAIPRGVLEYQESLSKEEEDEILQRWQEEHGAKNNGRTALLSGGLRYQTVAFSPEDLLLIDQLGWNRDEVLAVMATPRAVLGVTDGVNYAAALTQIRVCWDNAVLPMLAAEEAALDSTLFFEYPDNTFGAFDLGRIDALRVGLLEKIDAAKEFSSEALHMPPRVAFEVVGLDVPEYEGDADALVSPMLSPLGSVLDGTAAPAPDASTGTGKAAADVTRDRAPVASAEAPAVIERKPFDRKKRHAALIRVEAPIELAMRGRYRRWVAAERKGTLERFDKLANQARSRAKASARFSKQLDLEELSIILPDLAVSSLALGSEVRPAMVGALQVAFDFTADGSEIGIPIFEIDDARFIQFFDLRESLFRERVSARVYTNLRQSLTTGLQNGETIQALRARIGEAYGLAGSPQKTLLVARTETAGFFNGVREEMFDAQGVGKRDWSSAADENVRDDHVTFDGLDPQPPGTNYLALIGLPGVLEFPGDHRAPVGQVANCRCAHLAAQD